MDAVTSNDGADIVEQQEDVDEGVVLGWIFPVKLGCDDDDEEVEDYEETPDFLYFDGFVEIEFGDFAVLQRTRVGFGLFSDYLPSLLFAQQVEEGIQLPVLHLPYILYLHFLFLLL